jgi:hypothetical protein
LLLFVFLQESNKVFKYTHALEGKEFLHGKQILKVYYPA